MKLNKININNSQKMFCDNRLSRIVMLIFGILLVGYTSYRAYNIEFTYDESYSYLYFIKFGINEIIFMTMDDKLCLSNNHILNTIFLKIFSSLPIKSLLLLRIHGIAAHIIFLLVSYYILKRFTTHKSVLTLGFLVLNCNPFILDYFSIARGYGLANSFTLLSFYCINELFLDLKNTRLISIK